MSTAHAKAVYTGSASASICLLIARSAVDTAANHRSTRDELSRRPKYAHDTVVTSDGRRGMFMFAVYLSSSSSSAGTNWKKFYLVVIVISLEKMLIN